MPILASQLFKHAAGLKAASLEKPAQSSLKDIAPKLGRSLTEEFSAKLGHDLASSLCKGSLLDGKLRELFTKEPHGN
jgi:hypothetical protein